MDKQYQCQYYTAPMGIRQIFFVRSSPAGQRVSLLTGGGLSGNQ